MLTVIARTIGELLGPYDTAVLPIVQTFETQSFQDAFNDLVNTYDNISTREFLRTHAYVMIRDEVYQADTISTGVWITGRSRLAKHLTRM
jgi:hypothetical protein